MPLRSSQLCAALALAALATVPAWAMRGLATGAKPIDKPKWPAPALKLANLPTRVGYSDFEDYEYEFAYTGDTKTFQSALEEFATLQGQLQLYIYDGPADFYGLAPRVDWRFTFTNVPPLPMGEPLQRSPFEPRHPVPMLSVFLAPDHRVDWQALKIPANITQVDRRVDTSRWADSKGGVLQVNVCDNATSAALLGASIQIRRCANGKVLQTLTALTNAQGIAVARDLPPGQYRVEVLRPGYTCHYSYGYDNYGRTLGIIDGIRMDQTLQEQPAAQPDRAPATLVPGAAKSKT